MLKAGTGIENIGEKMSEKYVSSRRYELPTSKLKSNHSQASELPKKKYSLPRKSTRLEYVTLGNFFHQKSYLNLISAILWIMETVDKSWQSFGGFESRTRYQFEPKLIIKHAVMKTATYPISHNQATNFFWKKFYFSYYDFLH